MIFPDPAVAILDIPQSDPAFYPSILGAMLFGIALALFIEFAVSGSGLGLWGAIAINLCGGTVLAAWLMFGGLRLPLRGGIFLWLLVGTLLGVSLLEGWELLRRRNSG